MTAIPGFRSGVTWLRHQELADAYRTEELHCVASQLVSDNIHSRSFECQYRGRTLALDDDFNRDILNGYYKAFSRAVFDWKNVLGIVPWVPVMLSGGEVVPMALDFDVCEVGIYHDVASAQNCYVVRVSDRFHTMMRDQGHTPLFDPRGLGSAFGALRNSVVDDESVLHQDTREIVARRIDIREDNFLNANALDYGVFIMDGFNKNPTLGGIITSIVSRAQMMMQEYKLLNALHLKYLEKQIMFQPFNEIDGAGETKQMREFYKNTMVRNVGEVETSNYLRHLFHEATSELHQVDIGVERSINASNQQGNPVADGTGGVSAFSIVAEGENAYLTLARRLIMAQSHGYNAVVGGKISSFTPPVLDFSFLAEKELTLRKSICNLYGVPIGILDPLTSQQGNIEMQQSQFRITINSENQTLERALNVVFGVLELDNNADTFVAIKFRELIRPEAIRKLCKEKRQPQAWAFLKDSGSYLEHRKKVKELVRELGQLKGRYGDVEFKLDFDGDEAEPAWIPSDPMVFLGDSQADTEDDPWEFEEEFEDVPQKKSKKKKQAALTPKKLGQETRPYIRATSAHSIIQEGRDKRYQATGDTDTGNDETEHALIDQKQLLLDPETKLGEHLGNIPYLTSREVDDIYRYMICQLRNSDIVGLFERFLDQKADSWMKNLIKRTELSGLREARHIRIVYHIYGTCTIAEMVSIHALGAATTKELVSQLRYRMNLESESRDHSLSTVMLDKMQKQIATEVILASLKTAGVPVIGNLLMSAHREKVSAEKQRESAASKKPGTTKKSGGKAASSTKTTGTKRSRDSGTKETGPAEKPKRQKTAAARKKTTPAEEKEG